MNEASQHMFSLKGRTALITGGNGGLGLGMAEGLHAAGARVAVTGRNPEKNALVPSHLDVYSMDVQDEESVVRTIAQIVNKHGSLDILVNNAGVGRRATVTELRREEWDDIVAVNLTGAFLCSKHAVAAMRSTGGGGKIINIGSMYSQFGVPNSVTYGATKHGILGLTRAMAVELGRDGIQVNAILPGWYVTAMTQHLKSSPNFDFVRRKTPAGRWGNPEDLVGTVVFLSSKASDFITGAAIPVDGGYSVTDRPLYD